MTSRMHASPFRSVCIALILALALPLAAQAQGPAPTASPAPPAAAKAPPPAAPAQQDITVTAQQGPVVTVLPGGKDFISPMGEPFRSKDNLSGAEHWFARADTDGNGRLTLEEFKADEVRFFAVLDSDKDGDIGPIEIEHYEEVIAPEVKTMNTWGDVSKGKMDNDGNYTPPPYPERIGAGRFSYLALPEPVVYADANFDRGIDRREFNAAAEQRFKSLDRNGDGRITRAELPKPGG